MLRKFFTNLWFCSGIGFLFLFSLGCYLWYQYDTEPYRQQERASREYARRYTASQKTRGITQPEEKSNIVADESKTENPTTSKGTVNVFDSVSDDTKVKSTKALLSKTFEETKENVRVSPFGFGEYPEVPLDFPSALSWNDPDRQANLPDHALKNIELIERVLIKLWTEGDKSFHGSGSTYNGKIYPHYDNTVYVLYGETRMPDGTMKRYPTRLISGPQVVFDAHDFLSDNPPDHLRILDIESTGIDPYQFLDLPYKE